MNNAEITECDWIATELAEGSFRLVCKICATERTHDRPTLHRTCVARPATAAAAGTNSDYEEKARRIVEILREQGPSTAERVQRFLDLCPRVPGIMQGMAAAGLLTIDTAAVQPDTVFSIPQK